MDIIILEGPANSGKSTTINLVYWTLYHTSTIIKKRTVLPNTDGKDFEAVLSYTSKQGTKKVAFYSKGDTKGDCNNAIKNYASIADVLVIACSTTNFKPPLNTAPHTSQIVNKTIAASTIAETQASSADCNSIINLI